MARSSAAAAAKRASAAAASDENNGTTQSTDAGIDSQAKQYSEYLDRRQAIEDRLKVISVPPLSTARAKATTSASKKPRSRRRGRGGAKAVSVPDPVESSTSGTTTEPPTPASAPIPYVPKIDVHWDFVMKELMWLGADFSSERKRQVASAKKLGASVHKFHENKEKRRIKQLQMAEVKRKKLAAKLGRDVKGWWTKLEKIVAYKQKLSSDRERQAAMNKQLVRLVQQTEKYTKSLSLSRHKKHTSVHRISTEEEDSDDDDEDEELSTDEEGGRKRPRRRKRKKFGRDYSQMTIEEALALGAGSRRRKTKSRTIDYSRMKLEESEFYGESTADEGSVDGSVGSHEDEAYSDDENGSDYSDDETTLRVAMAEEMKARQEKYQKQRKDKHGYRESRGDENDSEEPADMDYSADPEELRKLYEEQEMEIEQVLERLKEAADDMMDTEEDGGTDQASTAKQVRFKEEPAPNKSATTTSNKPGRPERPKVDPGEDADDDGDASDVEDYHDALSFQATKEDDGDDMEDFQACEPEPDDETTMEAEERLGRDMTYEEEIALLNRENEMSIEELRAMYAGMEAASATDNQAPGLSENEEPDEEECVSSDDGDGEFEADKNEVDDETTMEAEERLGRDMTYEEELAMLNRENEMSVEELRAMYAGIYGSGNQEQNSNAPQTDQETDAEASATDDESHNDEDDEFEADQNEVDDETTMIAEERLGRDMTYEEELAMLNRENEMSIEELRAMYAGMNDVDEKPTGDAVGGDENKCEKGGSLSKSANDDNSNSSSDDITSASDDDGEFQVSGPPEVDDETTMEAEERLGRDMTYEEELAMLNRENEMSIEELRAMYAGINDTNGDGNGDAEESETGSNVDMETEDGSNIKKPRTTEAALDEGTNKRKRDDSTNSNSSLQTGRETKRSRDGRTSESENDGTAAMKALEASAMKARETLASRPFLLAPWVKLRKYQQVGLNWLVSLQSRRLNGILADEMGLGKTLQTISLLAYLASYKGIWGPHLVVVPTSVIINWETELKRFCPGLKVLCYYGNAKRRKELRTGWTKANWYHVVIASYQLAVQDAFAFKRKKWYYLILDEAQNIKNFQSQRWQTLINFNTQRRLLLTGTPLQNSLMELWSLLHFLMPYIFKSRKEFSYWFSNPMNNIIEGTGNRNEDVIKRLHGIIRPFVLRRLKKDVETQMPGKFEHIVKCQLSRRQMTLYEEFLSRSSTRQALKKGGNFMGMMNVLMQLRKVCNHPDLFEPRSVVTPFILPRISITTPRCICEVQNNDDFENRISPSISKPLWCGSSGQPNIDSALRHDEVESKGLNKLCTELHQRERIEYNDDESCPTELQSLIHEIYKKRNENQLSRIEFQNAVNRRRCKASTFLYSSQLLKALEVECDIFGRKEPAEVRGKKVIETPTKLLELRRSEMERASDMEQTIEKFVFRVPPAGGRAPLFDNGIPETDSESGVSKPLERMLLEPIEEIMMPYRKARVRLTSFFPDKKLVQYDAGKLQALATLLRKLKEGGHRCLIFTQMGKVLDVLEAFLSMNGHTYLRLDGSTGVDRRQRFMDRFNNDTKIFCFILSTRSGGTGINLTGADTVIFYDSDWNPAMDAQAQDRAHRIGQTRDVHIYRLITEHSIEENILKKAQKKKNLDIMVMDQGKFNASAPRTHGESSNQTDDVKDVYTKKGLQAILGFDDEEKDLNSEEQDQPIDMSKAEMEKAMASLEDEDDVKALHGAQKEAEEDQKEFDDDAAIPKEGSDDEEGEADNGKGKKAKRNTAKKGKSKNDSTSEGDEENTDEKDLEREFAAWQSAEGFNEKVIDNSLSPMERYGLKFREEIDPFYSIFYINEERRRMEAMEGVEEVDMDEVEKQKEMEEQQAIDNQDLLATGIRPEDLVRQRSLYRREKVRLRSEKMRRKITGELWSQKVDGLSKKLFWYNEETGEATWDMPRVVSDLRAEESAIEKGWSNLPNKPLVNIMAFLLPFPERQNCSAVCHQWRTAATDIQFVVHVYPVEMGALANREPSKRHYNHYATIEDALVTALPGDTIELGDGHYWVNDPGIIVDKPLRFVGDENNPANVVIEMSGSVQWTAKGGWIEGITFRRPKMSSGKELPTFPMVEVKESGKINMIRTVFDNDGSTGPAGALSGSGNKGTWQDIVFRNGGSAGIHIDGGNKVEVELIRCTIKGSQSDGLVATNKAKFKLERCIVEDNKGHGIRLATGGCQASIFESRFKDNIVGVIKKEPHCIVTSSSNIAFLTVKPKKQIPGFKLMLLRKDPSLLQRKI